MTVKQTNNKVVRFSWPDFVLYEDVKFVAVKNPTFARYMLPELI